MGLNPIHGSKRHRLPTSGFIMANYYNGSICLSDIPKEKITEGKNGKKYLNVKLWVNDVPDRYENIGSIQVQQTKDEREAGNKATYIGNFKAPAENKQVQAAENKVVTPEYSGDLPF